MLRHSSNISRGILAPPPLLGHVDTVTGGTEVKVVQLCGIHSTCIMGAPREVATSGWAGRDSEDAHARCAVSRVQTHLLCVVHVTSD
jgi:hypothetical protein